MGGGQVGLKPACSPGSASSEKMAGRLDGDTLLFLHTRRGLPSRRYQAEEQCVLVEAKEYNQASTD